VRETLGRLAALEATIGALVNGQIEACEPWPDGYVTPNRRMVYATLNWCQEHHTEIVDILRTLAGAAPMQMPASIDVLTDPQLKDRFERWWSTPALGAVERLKLYKLVWDRFVASQMGPDRLGVRRPPYALRKVLRRQFDHRAQPKRPRSAVGKVPRDGRRIAGTDPRAGLMVHLGRSTFPGLAPGNHGLLPRVLSMGAAPSPSPNVHAPRRSVRRALKWKEPSR
jgi:hypothetical protein